MMKQRYEKSRVLVVGEALVDVIDRGNTTARIPGASPANVALGLSRLGAHVELLTYISPDDDGMSIVYHLLDSGVRVMPASLGAGRTPTARALLDDRGQAQYLFDVEWALPPIDDIKPPDVLHIGSYSAFREPGAEQVRRLAVRTRAAGGLVTFDPNIRPALIGISDAARPKFEGLAQISSVVKLSEEDASWLYPDASTESVLSRLCGLGPQLVAITHGARGSTLATRRSQLRVPAIQADISDTIGAGDSYMAALVQSAMYFGVNSLSKRKLRQIGSRSAMAAGITVARSGADLSWSSEIAK